MYQTLKQPIASFDDIVLHCGIFNAKRWLIEVFAGRFILPQKTNKILTD